MGKRKKVHVKEKPEEKARVKDKNRCARKDQKGNKNNAWERVDCIAVGKWEECKKKKCANTIGKL